MRVLLGIVLALLVLRTAWLVTSPEADAAAGSAAEPAPASGGQTLYQFVDAQGRVRLVESLAAVPPAERSSAGRVELRARPAAAAGRTGASAAASRPARPQPEVTVFTSNSCSRYCQDQLRDLASAGIAYRERNLDRDPQAGRELGRYDPRRAVPTTVLGEQVWRGYSASHVAAIRHALAHADAADGGPATLVLYTQAHCPLSRRLMSELDRLGVSYENRDIDQSGAARAELLQLTGRPGVPVATVGDRLFTGWAPDRAREIQAALEPGWRWWPF